MKIAALAFGSMMALATIWSLNNEGSRVLNASGDSQSPVIESLALSPTTISTTNDSAMVTVTAELTDFPAGVCVSPCCPTNICNSPTQVRFDHIGTSQWADGIFELSSGSVQDGTFTAEVEFPQFSAIGTWEIEYVLVVDNVNNYRFANTAELKSSGFPTKLTNSSSGTIPTPSPTSSPSPTPSASGDLDCSGSVDSHDVLLLLLFVGGVDSQSIEGCIPIGE